MLRGYVLALIIVCILVYWVAARGWQLRYRLPDLRDAARSTPAFSAWRAAWNRASCAAPRWCCCWPWRCGSTWAATKWSTTSTARFLVGIDYVDQNIGLPLQWLVIVACFAAAVLVWMGRWILAGLHGARAGGGFRRSARLVSRALRAAQRDLAAAAVHRDPHSRHAQRLRPRTARSRKWSSRPSPDAPIDVEPAQGPARQRPPVGHARLPRHHHADPGAAPLLRVPRHRRGPLHHRRPVPAGAAGAARARYPPASRRRAPTGSTRPSSIRTATAWCWPKSAR